MVNTKHDTHAYERTSNGERGYQREIFDGNVLYESFLKAKQGSDWKPQVQRFEMNLLFELSEGLQVSRYMTVLQNTLYVMKF